MYDFYLHFLRLATIILRRVRFPNRLEENPVILHPSKHLWRKGWVNLPLLHGLNGIPERILHSCGSTLAELPSLRHQLPKKKTDTDSIPVQKYLPNTWKLILIRLASASTREKDAMLVMARDWAAASQMSTSTNRWTTVREPKWT